MLAPSWTLTFPDWAKSTAVVKITVAKNLTRTPSRAKTSWEYGLRSNSVYGGGKPSRHHCQSTGQMAKPGHSAH